MTLDELENKHLAKYPEGSFSREISAYLNQYFFTLFQVERFIEWLGTQPGYHNFHFSDQITSYPDELLVFIRMKLPDYLVQYMEAKMPNHFALPSIRGSKYEPAIGQDILDQAQNSDTND